MHLAGHTVIAFFKERVKGLGALGKHMRSKDWHASTSLGVS